MKTLAEHLAEQNARDRAWAAEDPKNRWASQITEDLAYWAEVGITTVEEFEDAMEKEHQKQMRKNSY